MIWLTWRQFRTQALVAAGLLAVLTIFLVILGLRLRGAYDADPTPQLLKDRYFNVLLLTGFVIILVPAVLGAFCGAQLIALEFEAGTHRLVWNQSITRTRW